MKLVYRWNPALREWEFLVTPQRWAKSLLIHIPKDPSIGKAWLRVHYHSTEGRTPEFKPDGNRLDYCNGSGFGQQHEWVEQPGEPAVDTCYHCGEARS